MPNYLLHAGGLLNAAFPWSVRWYATSSGTEATVETAWHSEFKAMWNTAGLNAFIPTLTTFTNTYTSTMNSAWKQTTKTQTLENLPGTGGASLPYHVCEVITWRTAQATKYGRGRWYFPALTTASVATGGYIMSATTVTDVVAAVNVLLAGLIGTVQPVILHRKGTKSGPGPLTTDNIIAGDFGNNYDTQRRRADKSVEARTSLTF